MRVDLPAVEQVTELEQATVLLHPLRIRILQMARTPASASMVAARLGLPRQRVNYHAGKLAAAGLLIRAGRRRKRNMVEQLYVATARSYVLDPGLLGPLAADAADGKDRRSAERLETMSMATEVQIESARAPQFEAALHDAVSGIVARFSDARPPGLHSVGNIRWLQLLVGCYESPPSTGALS